MGNPGDKYTIRILNGGKKSSTKKATAKATSQTSIISDFQELISASVAARELRTVYTQAASFAVSTIEITTGNMVSQQRMQVAVGAVSKIANYVTLIGTHNYAGAAIMAINDTLSFVSNAPTLQLNNARERESLALSRERAGVAFNQSRLGAAK